MNTLIRRIFLGAASGTLARRLRPWTASHRFSINLAAHCFLFMAGYFFSLFMLQDLFRPGEARALFERSVPLLVLIRLAVFWHHDLYEGVWIYVSFADLINIIRAAVISTIVFALPGIIWAPLRIPERVLLLDTFFCIILVYGVRVAARSLQEKLLIQSGAPLGQEILLLGPLKRVQTLANEMLGDPFSYYRPVAVVDVSAEKPTARLRISDVPVLSVADVLSRRDRFNKIRYLVLCWPNASPEEIDRLVAEVKPLGIPFTSLPYLDEILPPEPEVSPTPVGSEERNGHALPKTAGLQKRIFLSPPHMSGLEQEYVRRAFRSNFIAPLGPLVDAFEREFSELIGVANSLALCSGTAAIHLALKVLGVGPGDMVIASTLTFIGSVTPIIFQGAKPVFIDCDRKSWTMDPDLLAVTLERLAAAGNLPRAVLPTDLYGQCCDYDSIRAICDSYGVALIVDAAEALGATYRGRHAGADATAAIFSFNGNKIITTSGGGMLVSADRDLIEQARFLSQQARDPVPHYEHSHIGYNYRLSNILAGVGLAQLKVLEDRVKKKREIFDYYKNALDGVPGIEFMPEAEYGRSNRWLTVLLVTPEEFGATSEDVRVALGEVNIESRPVWKPMHLQPVFRGSARSSRQKGQGRALANEPSLAEAIGGMVSEDLFRRGLCLPSGTAMTESELAGVVQVIRNCQGKGLKA